MQTINSHIHELACRGHVAAGNVIDLSIYRRWRKLRRPAGVIDPQQTRIGIHIAESDDEYFDRMTVYVAAFVFMAALVLIGIWLINGITEWPHR